VTMMLFFFFSSRRRHTMFSRDWSSDVCSSDLEAVEQNENARAVFRGGKPQIERQKHRLADWLEGIVGGVYDEAYFERRARIGRRSEERRVGHQIRLTSVLYL